MPGITERLGSDVLVVQGAVGTYLAQKGFEGNVCSLNLEEPDAIEQMHQLYRIAGADCAVTNTFSATSSCLAQEGLAGQVGAINMEGVRLAREAGFPHVLAAMGPCGVQVEPGSGLAALEARASCDEAAAAAQAQGPAVGSTWSRRPPCRLRRPMRFCSRPSPRSMTPWRRSMRRRPPATCLFSRA